LCNPKTNHPIDEATLVSAILISRSDVLGTNGLVHVIDGVLRP
jgi:hypothetical protein